MNLFALEGYKVRCSFPNNGTASDKERVKKYLVADEIYTVERTEVHNWNTDVWLKEVPNVIFNSVHFTEVSPQSEEDTNKHPSLRKYTLKQ